MRWTSMRDRASREVDASRSMTRSGSTFADATEDRQFIHVDPEAAAQTPFGGTIAHGFLTLSLLSRMGAEAMLVPEGLKMAVNYGLDRVRFLAPVRAGSRVRGRFRLDSVEEKAPGQLLMRHHVTRGDRGRGQARADRRMARPDVRLRRTRMREAVIVSTARTPIGRAYSGAFNATPGPTLASSSLTPAIERAGIDPGEIDDVVVGRGAHPGHAVRQYRPAGRAARRLPGHRRRA